MSGQKPMGAFSTLTSEEWETAKKEALGPFDKDETDTVEEE